MCSCDFSQILIYQIFLFTKFFLQSINIYDCFGTQKNKMFIKFVTAYVPKYFRMVRSRESSASPCILRTLMTWLIWTVSLKQT